MATITLNQPAEVAPRALQRRGFKSGNEMAALAAQQINYHLMGYYPITPSTEIAEYLDEAFTRGEHQIVMIPADGEHGGAGICYGASLGGGRVINATSSQGFIYALEQLLVQASTHFPMVLNLAARCVSAPLDIRCDHSDLYYALNTGWLILLARSPQAVYDLNIVGLRLAEHPEVRLPVIVAYDGFFTSHQKRVVHSFEDPLVVRSFVGDLPPTAHALDPRRPVTVGAYMNEPDLINAKYQLHRSMEAASRVLPALLEEYGRLSGRHYPVVDAYRVQGARAALVLLNSAVDTAKAVADQLWAEGLPVGVVTVTALRPFPVEPLRQALSRVPAVLVGDRADSYGSGGGNLTHEIKAALYDLPDRPQVISRVYGLGGREFTVEDARVLFGLALEAARTGRVSVPFDYYGVDPGTPGHAPPPGLPPIRPAEAEQHLVHAEPDAKTGRLLVTVPSPRDLVRRTKRIAPGHGACPGCGIFPSLHQFLMGIEGDVVILNHTGCAEIVSSGFPHTSYRVSYVHNLFQNGAATLSGLVEMFHERQRRGEIPGDVDQTFILVTGDGGLDIGLGPTVGTAIRNHRLIVLEYDNQAYMNTGSQLSYDTPFGFATATSHVGAAQSGKAFHHRDIVQLLAATNIPYLFTGVEGLTTDLVKKATKAQWYARHEGMVFGKLLSACPLQWRYDEKDTVDLLKKAVDSCFFPLYEIERGKTAITYDPEARSKRVPLAEWLAPQGRTRHLLQPEYAGLLHALEAEVERRWTRLKAMAQHPLL